MKFILSFIVSSSLVAPILCGDSSPTHLRPPLACGSNYEDVNSCLKAGCVFDSTVSPAVCVIPDATISGYYYYSDIDPSPTPSTPFVLPLRLRKDSGLYEVYDSTGHNANEDADELSLQVAHVADEIVHVKLTSKADGGNKWEVPDALLPRPKDMGSSEPKSDKAIKVELDEERLTFTRPGESTHFLSLNFEHLVYQSQYLQVSFSSPADVGAPDHNSYGFGESTRVRQAISRGETRTLWNSDVWAAGFNETLYGAHPFLMRVGDGGEAHGFFLLNSDAQALTLHEKTLDEDGRDERKATVQAAGGVVDLYVFSGGSPAAVVKQYLAVIGNPHLPPYWSLGFHNCRWGYENAAYISDVVANYSDAGIALETQWADIDYMQDYLDFTLDAVDFSPSSMGALVSGLHSRGQHFVPIVDPGISATKEGYDAFDRGVEGGVFIRDLNGEAPYLGQVWPGITAFPDWLSPNATEWWTNQMEGFKGILDYDGIWIDMNECSNFCNTDGKDQVCEVNPDWNGDGCPLNCKTIDAKNRYDYPPWVPTVGKGNLGGKTIPMSAVHWGGVREYDAHNLFGFMESIATKAAVEAVTGKRAFVLSRSSFAGSGRHTAHWTGDNAATWEDLRAQIGTLNNMAMFGLSMVGADMCGFAGDTNEELCARWVTVGAFSPFSRNHNTLGALPQELYRWDSVAAISRGAFALRYQMLPTLYTALWASHAEGAITHSSLWMNFPDDPSTYGTDDQFMWADSVLFTPALYPETSIVTGYFPPGLWYPLPCSALSIDDAVPSPGGFGAGAPLKGEYHHAFITPMSTTNVHVRGGSILPMQEFRMTVAEAKTTPYTLLVPLDEVGEASGRMFIDDGETIMPGGGGALVDFSFKGGKLSSKLVFDGGFSPEGSLLTVVVRGLDCEGNVSAGMGKETFKVETLKGDSRITLGDRGLDIKEAFEVWVSCDKQM